jgi:hypothetical protein
LRARLPAEHEHHFADFAIEYDPQWANVIHLIGMESPGLTSSLSLGVSVGEMARRALSS